MPTMTCERTSEHLSDFRVSAKDDQYGFIMAMHHPWNHKIHCALLFTLMCRQHEICITFYSSLTHCIIDYLKKLAMLSATIILSSYFAMFKWTQPIPPVLEAVFWENMNAERPLCWRERQRYQRSHKTHRSTASVLTNAASAESVLWPVMDITSHFSESCAAPVGLMCVWPLQQTQAQQ